MTVLTMLLIDEDLGIRMEFTLYLMVPCDIVSESEDAGQR